LPQELASTSDVVLLSLANDEALKEVISGPGGVLAGLRARATVIDFSTISPHVSRDLASEVHAKGAAMLDAPVSGSTPQAEPGALNIMVGGDEDVYQRNRPIFAALGKSFYLGPNGMGLVMKLVVNSLLGLGVQALAEAVSLGEAGGVDKDRLLDVLGEMVVLSPAQSSKFENIRTGHYPSAFPLEHMNKDYELIADLAWRVKVPMPATSAAQQMSRAALARGDEEDFSAVIGLMEQLAGGDGNHVAGR
jgi:3-hydroxyisobutyrate dehydrogenase-like beta-hydroxyacid dehydrogenase